MTYVFTPGGRLDHLTDWGARTSTYTYTPSGLPDTLVYPNGLKAVYTYDRAQRLIAVADAVGSVTANREVYALDGEGNRVVNDEYVQGISVAPSTTWSASVKVNSDPGTTAQDHPQIAIAPNGWTYLVWDDLRDGNANIYFDLRDPGTGLWGATDRRVNTDTGTRIQLNPAVSVDSASNAYIVWQDERNGAGKPDIFYQKRTFAGGSWLLNDVKISDEAGGGGGSIQRNPRIAGKADGDETVVWVDFRSNQKNIWSSILNDGAGSWGTNQKVTDNFTADKDFPDVVLGADGTSYAVWQDNRNGTTNHDIYFASRPPGQNSVWSSNEKVSDDPGTAAQRQPRIGIDGAGNVTVLWLDDRASPTTIRMSRRLAGTAKWTPSVVVTDAAARPVSVALAVRSDGMAQVTFGDTRGTNADIYISEYDPWLRLWSTSTLVSDDPGTALQQAPSVAYSSTEIFPAWRDDRAGNADVRARRAALAGGAEHFTDTYDGLNRLKDVTGPVAEGFVLDPASNISSRTGPSATYTYDTSNRLTSDGSQTFTWNNADRLTTRGADTFSPDPLGRLKSTTTSGTTRTFTYSGDGLVQSATQGTTATFLWDNASTPSALVKSGTDSVVYGLTPLYGVRADGTTYTFAADGLGSVRAELNQAGALTKSFRYRVNGEIAVSVGGTATLLGYAGELRDANGLIYLRDRWYDPVASIFVRRDTYLGALETPVTLNGYCYASRRPTVMTDPSGRDPGSRGVGRKPRGDAGQCLATVVGAMLLIEASTFLTVTSLALVSGGAVVVPLTGGAALPVTGASWVAATELEFVAIAGYLTAGYMLWNAPSGPCKTK